MQIVAEDSRIQLPVQDLTKLSVDERATKVNELAKYEAALPFDLSRGPVVRARVLRLAPEEHLLLLAMHHIVSDAWSAGIFFQELTTLYKEIADNGKSALLPPAFQYGDYA